MQIRTYSAAYIKKGETEPHFLTLATTQAHENAKTFDELTKLADEAMLAAGLTQHDVNELKSLQIFSYQTSQDEIELFKRTCNLDLVELLGKLPID